VGGAHVPTLFVGMYAPPGWLSVAGSSGEAQTCQKAPGLPQPPERRGCRSFDTATEYGAVAMMVTEETRTRQPTGGPRQLLVAALRPLRYWPARRIRPVRRGLSGCLPVPALIAPRLGTAGWDYTP
jgi:hypothetical protein